MVGNVNEEVLKKVLATATCDRDQYFTPPLLPALKTAVDVESGTVDMGAISTELVVIKDWRQETSMVTKAAEVLHLVTKHLARASGTGHARDAIMVTAGFELELVARELLDRRDLKQLPNFRRELLRAAEKEAEAGRAVVQDGLTPGRGGNDLYFFLAEKRAKWKAQGGTEII